MTRRLTATDASFLYMETASGPMHISSVYVLEGELAFDRFFQHYDERMHLLPSYRRKLAQVPFNLAHPTWVDDPDFDLANHLDHFELPPGSTLEDALDAAATLNEPMLDRSRPLWKVWLISGVPDKTLILQMTHHAMIDGVSGIELTTILYDFDPVGANREPPEKPWEPEPVPSAVERFSEALADNLQAARESRPWELLSAEKPRQLLARASRIMGQFFTRPAVTAPFNAGMVGPKRKVRFTKQSFAEIREIRRSLGGTINDVVLTVVTEAVSRYLVANEEQTDDKYLRIMCPVSVRTENESGALGNRVSAIFPMLPAWPMDVVQRLTAVCAETERIKHDEEAQALALMTESGSSIWPLAMAPTQLVGTPYDPTVWAARTPLPVLPDLRGWRPPNFGLNFVCTNVPGVQVPQYLAGHKVTDTIGLLVLSGNVGFSVTILSYNQELFFSFICEPRLMPDLEMIVAEADASFDELLAAARTRTQQLSA
jgi:diacylglycerol O-acyltransferase / wax synthase